MAHNSIRFGYPDRAAVFHCVDPGVRCTSFFFCHCWSLVKAPLTFSAVTKGEFPLGRERDRASEREGEQQAWAETETGTIQ